MYRTKSNFTCSIVLEVETGNLSGGSGSYVYHFTLVWNLDRTKGTCITAVPFVRINYLASEYKLPFN
jgi:hypothetical protein